MPSRKEITDQGSEVKRLTDAIRDLRQAQLKSNDPKQVAQLGEALKVMRLRVEEANIGFGKLKEQYESLSTLGKAIADFKAATVAGKAGMVAGGAAKGIAAAGQLPTEGIAALATAAGGAVGAITGMARAVGAFVEASNPAEMIRFNIAMKDLMASFGVIFEPVILVLTEFANLLNQFVTSLQPVLGPLVQMLASAFLDIAKAVLDAVAPIVESLIPIFQALADLILPPLVAVFRVLSDAIRSVINWIRSWLGMDPLERASDGSGGRTVAAQRASQIGIEQIGEQARAAAFGSASATGLLQRQNDLTLQGNEYLRQIANRESGGFLGIPGFFRRLGASAADAINGVTS